MRLLGLTLLLLIFIHATVPSGSDQRQLADELRRIAVLAGCAAPVVEMMLREPSAPLEIIVRCPDEIPIPTPPVLTPELHQ